jgi:hypothetical protein
MSTTITIPSHLVPEVREATVYQLGQVAEEISTQADLKEGDVNRVLERFDPIRNLLDAIGSADGPVEIDEAHKPILLEMVGDQARAMAQLLDDELKAGNTDEVERYTPRVKNLTAYTAALTAAGA